MKLDSLLEQTGAWLKTDSENSDIVISSRIRLARNLRKFFFLTKADDMEIKKIEEYISHKIKNIDIFRDYIYFSLNNLSTNELCLLKERHIISKEHAEGIIQRSVFFKKDESVSIMVNEEDHLRIQMLCSGSHLLDLWEKISHIDDILENHMPFAFHKRFGYLTACPSNVGTGIRVSVMLHLPALNKSGQMEKVYYALVKHNLILRGLYGEGSRSLGDFFQLSNQFTLGKSEKEIIRIVNHIIPQIIKYERQVRENMLQDNRTYLHEQMREAYEALTNSKMITSEETLKHLSWIRIAASIGMITIKHVDINKIFLLSQPAHIQQKKGQILESHLRDEIRANLIKDYFKNYGLLTI